METLKNFLWPIVLIGGLGAFIDFLIGKTGQAKAKDFLLKWWVRFDDVHWRNFGKEEGLFAGYLIEKWFGRKIWSRRRFASAFIFLVLCGLVGYSEEFSSLSGINTKNALTQLNEKAANYLDNIFIFPMLILTVTYVYAYIYFRILSICVRYQIHHFYDGLPVWHR
jgi:hypothetical protein